MKLYFAAGAQCDYLKDKRILESFWYKKDALDAMRMTPHFFLDSGGFTAFTKKVEIKLDDYADFVRKHKSRIEVCASLDIIGDPKRTHDAWVELNKQGVPTIPVFHCREEARWLKKYLDQTDYIALGGMVPESQNFLRPWLDDLWGNYLTDSKGKPIVKVHAFGMTIVRFMERYPWFSIDSSSWTYGARFGVALCYWPNKKMGNVYMNEAHGSARKQTDGNYNRLSPLARTRFHEFCEMLGSDIEGLKTMTRDALDVHNIKVYEWWSDNYVREEKFVKRESALFT